MVSALSEMTARSPRASLTEASSPSSAARTAEPSPLPPLREVLARTDHWERTVLDLGARIDSVYKQPLFLKADSNDSKSDIPISAARYPEPDAKHAWVTSKNPVGDLTDLTIIRDVSFGYTIKGKFRSTGKVDFIAVDSEGMVRQVGSRSSDVLDVFKENIFGKNLTNAQITRQYEVIEKVVDALRRDPACVAKLAAFNEKRGHKEGWSDSARLAYYSPSEFNLLSWAQANDIAEVELYQAGLVNRTVGRDGVAYTPKVEPVIFIPFKNETDRLVLYRMRVIDPGDGPKYRSAPLDRAHRQPETVNRQLYQSELLKEGSLYGKTLLITEGEFKCMVTKHLTEVATVGITGITQVTDEIIRAIMRSGASRIVVALDRDPIGKGIPRVDGLTDSERAAYLITNRLIRAGHSDVKIGIFPDVNRGKKLGIDDFLLRKEVTDPSAELEKVISSAHTPHSYEKLKKLDVTLHELYTRRQHINQMLRDFSRWVDRDPRFAPGSTDRVEAESTLRELREMSDLLNRAFQHRLKTEHGGARRITQPQSAHMTFFASSKVHVPEAKQVATPTGDTIPLARLQGDIPIIRVYPGETARPEKARGLDFPYSMRELSALYKRSTEPTQDLIQTFERGRQALELGGAVADWRGLSYRDFAECVLAGFISGLYPEDDFKLVRGMSMSRTHPSYSEEATTVQLAVLSDGKPVAFCSMPIWELQRGLGDSSRHVLATDRTVSAQHAFLREPDGADQLNKLGSIGTIISKKFFEANFADTCAVMGNLGVSPQTTRDVGAVLVKNDDMAMLVNDFRHARPPLLNQAIQAGLLVSDDQGFAVPRFEGSVVLIPERGPNGGAIGFTVLPVDAGAIGNHKAVLGAPLGTKTLLAVDRLNGSLPPVPKMAFPLDSSRSAARAFDSSARLFGDSELDRAENRTLIVASSEIVALQIRSAARIANLDVVVVATRELGSLSPAMRDRIAASKAARIVFIGERAESCISMIEHGNSALSDALTEAAEFGRSAKTAAVKPEVVLLNAPPLELFRQSSRPGELLQMLLAEASPASESPRTHAMRLFSETLRKVELTVGSSDKKYIDRNGPQILSQLRNFYGRCNGEGLPPTLEGFLGVRYGTSGANTLRTLFSKRQLPVYRHGRGPSEPVAARTVDQIDQVVHYKPNLSGLPARAVVANLSEIHPRFVDFEELRRAVTFLNRTTPCEISESKRPALMVMSQRYETHNVTITISGEVHSTIDFGSDRAAARTNAVNSLYQKLHRQNDRAFTLLRDASDAVSALRQEEARAVATDRRGELLRVLDLIKSSGAPVEFRETNPKSSDDRLTYCTTTTVTIGDSEPIVVSGDGLKADGSAQVAAHRVLEEMNRRGSIPAAVLDEVAASPAKQSPIGKVSAALAARANPQRDLQSELAQLGPTYKLVMDPEPTKSVDKSPGFIATWGLSILVSDGKSEQTIPVGPVSVRGVNEEEARISAAYELTTLVRSMKAGLPGYADHLESKRDYDQELIRFYRALQKKDPKAFPDIVRKCDDLPPTEVQHAHYRLELPDHAEPIQGEGSGRTRKIARAQAAKQILEQLKKLYPDEKPATSA